MIEILTAGHVSLRGSLSANGVNGSDATSGVPAALDVDAPTLGTGPKSSPSVGSRGSNGHSPGVNDGGDGGSGGGPGANGSNGGTGQRGGSSASAGGGGGAGGTVSLRGSTVVTLDSEVSTTGGRGGLEGSLEISELNGQSGQDGRFVLGNNLTGGYEGNAIGTRILAIEGTRSANPFIVGFTKHTEHPRT